MMPNDVDDVASALTRAARLHGVPVTTLMPNHTCRPLWAVADRGCCGIATFYDGDVFHLFQSRMNTGYDLAFHAVAAAVQQGRRIDYVALHRQMNSPSIEIANLRARLRRMGRRLRASLVKRLFPATTAAS